MRKSMKFIVVIGMVAALGAVTDAVVAICNDGLIAVYPVVQCGSVGTAAPSQNWFAPNPTTGAVTAAWWQLGFGNLTDNSGGDPSGNGFVAGLPSPPFPPPGTPNRFIGNDSGTATGSPAGLQMVDASAVGGTPGGLCFGNFATWTLQGVDGCADNDRDGAPGTFTASSNDQHLNPYYNTGLGTGGQFATPNFDYYIDAPMGVLLTESTGQQFALAFFANRFRNMNATDATPGHFDMQFINNGDANPVTGLLNIVPWQPVPQPNVSATFTNPADTASARVLSFTWTPVRIVDDSSTRGGRASILPPGRTGMGARDQGPLVHHVVETAPIDPNTGNCGTFVPDPGSAVSHPTNTTGTTVPQDTCVRLRTQFGTVPLQTAINQTNAGNALLGDIGFTVHSQTTLVGGVLARQSVKLDALAPVGPYLNVRFSSINELDVSRFEVVGIRPNGRETVLKSTNCTSCSTGLGDHYEVRLRRSELRGAKQIVVVMQPSGDRSNVMDIAVGHRRHDDGEGRRGPGRDRNRN